MPWLKAGDNAATHPRVMRLMSLDGEQAVNEVFGFVVRCALQSAGHMTDYVIDEGTASLIGMSRTEDLLQLARRAGLMVPERRSGQRVWRIVDDPEFLHMRLRSEIEWERQRKRDASNPALIVPVRLRDGDACRYCGVIVQWRARRGTRRGTYDHREPGRPATVDTYVVSCFGCNAARREDPKADEQHPLLPAPPEPFYGPDTVELLAGHGHVVQPSTPRPESRSDTARTTPRPTRQVDTARTTSATPRPAAYRAHDPATHPPGGYRAHDLRDAAASGIPRATPVHPTGQVDTAQRDPDSEPDTAHAPPPAPDLQISAEIGRSEVYGPGRDGSGRDGSAPRSPAQVTGADPPAPPTELARRRRAPRSRRRGAP